ncbi:phosphotransferase [Flavobacterium muglaense]|uniref:Phosphotransferase n=1 Tax=Flavobacterium muglaense TaxID=2764716 RepID=A0A923MXS0_9FLAO|nr:phosphotransferase [Flavobacterium muglaense]MBC5837182.1 phosphotransferase [Flavobacterium muglaense]MBC5843711.1 phosphotransferase [Flavobacterium muglaense]
MTHFPVTSTTLSATALGQFAIEKYNLSANATCQLFRTGINHTYFITDNDHKYMLRVYCYNWRSKEEIEAEIDLLLLLKQNSTSISYPIADRNKQFIQDINAPEGLRHAVLFSFAEGGKMRFMDQATCFKIGVLMAQVHQITVDKSCNRVAYNPETLLKTPYKQALQHFPAENPEMQYLKTVCDRITQTFESVDHSEISKGIVHLDIWYDNMSITEESAITIFDFDFCGNGPLVLDVAYFCKQLFHIENNKVEYESKKEQFLKGYQSIRSLTVEELQLIPEAGAAIWLFYLGVQSQRFDWSNVFLTENYLKLMYVARLKSWLDYPEKQKS